MARFDAGPLIYWLRVRKKWERKTLLELYYIDDSTLMRIEDDTQCPTLKTIIELMEAMGIPAEDFVYPMVDYHGMEIYTLRDRINQALDRGDTTEAEALLKQIEENPGFRAGIQLQFKLSKKARLLEMMGASADIIFPLIREALDITFKGFDENDLGNTVFIFEEIELLHTKARVHAKNGETAAAINILSQLKSSMSTIPEGDKEKEQQYAPVLLSLSMCLLQINDYKSSSDICDLGAAFSAARKQGRLNPDFEYTKAFALKGLGQTDKCKVLLQYAYFGYIQLGEASKALEVLSRAKEDFGIEINNYHVNELDLMQLPKILYNRGEPFECYSLGTIFRGLREKAGLSLAQLSSGICHKSTLSRIEMDESQTKIYTLEAIMQRLGRDIHQYVNFFLSKEEFLVTQLRDRIEVLIAERRFAEAEKMLGIFQSMKCVLKHKVNVQFIKMIRAILFAVGCSGPNAEYPVMLLDALKITCPDFDERNIEKYRLTFYETAIITQYARYFGDAGDPKHAVDIFRRLRHNLTTNYADEVMRSRMFSIIITDYSTCLGRANQRNEALAVISEGEQFERYHGRLTMLADLTFNKAYNMYMLGKEKESLPYFALSYYSASMFSEYGRADDQKTIKDFVETHFNLEFD